VLLDVGDESNSSDVVSADGISDVTDFQFSEVLNLVLSNVVSNGVSNVDVWVGESEGSGVVSDDVWVSIGSQGLLDDLNQFELGFILLKRLKVESSLLIIEDSESIVGLLDGDDIHNSEGESSIGSDLSVDLDLSLLIVQDGFDLSEVKSVLQLLLDDQGQRNALSSLVGSLRWSNSVDSSGLSHHPALGGSDFLQMLFRSSCHILLSFRIFCI